METLVTSFYADVAGRDYYSRSAERLRARLTALNVPHEIVELPTQGSYRANCLAKPGFILEQLRRTAAPLVWLDVDAVVHKPLDVFDDFAEAPTAIRDTQLGRTKSQIENGGSGLARRLMARRL